MDILDDMGVSKLSAKVLKVNYSFKCRITIDNLNSRLSMFRELCSIRCAIMSSSKRRDHANEDV